MDEMEARVIASKVKEEAQEQNPVAQYYDLKFTMARLKNEPLAPIAEELKGLVNSVFDTLHYIHDIVEVFTAEEFNMTVDEFIEHLQESDKQEP